MEFLKNYTSSKSLTIKLDGIKEKYLCKLCNQILYKPKCTKCGCNFCGSCLDVYLDKNEKMCPNCKDCGINAEDSFPSWNIENRLLKVKMTCPNIKCNTKIEIGQMESHLNECTESQIKCCMFSYGCENSFDSNLGIKSHLQDNLNDHFEMLKNRVESFQDKIQQVETESNEKVIQNKLEIEMKIERGDEALREQIVAGEEALEEKIIKVVEENKALEEKMKEEREEWKKEMGNLKEEMTKIMNEKFELSKQSMIIGEYYIAVDGEAKVKFTGVSKKIKDTEAYSNDFIINKYCFNIGMYYFYSNGFIKFELYIVPGSHDLELEWPLKNRIEMVILRKDDKIYRTVQFEYSETHEKWKQCYWKQTSRDICIQESVCFGHIDRIMNSKNEVNLIIKMLK